jgi:hypothetical protein
MPAMCRCRSSLLAALCSAGHSHSGPDCDVMLSTAQLRGLRERHLQRQWQSHCSVRTPHRLSTPHGCQANFAQCIYWFLRARVTSGTVL